MTAMRAATAFHARHCAKGLHIPHSDTTHSTLPQKQNAIGSAQWALHHAPFLLQCKTPADPGGQAGPIPWGPGNSGRENAQAQQRITEASPHPLKISMARFQTTPQGAVMRIAATRLTANRGRNSLVWLYALCTMHFLHAESGFPNAHQPPRRSWLAWMNA